MTTAMATMAATTAAAVTKSDSKSMDDTKVLKFSEALFCLFDEDLMLFNLFWT